MNGAGDGSGSEFQDPGGTRTPTSCTVLAPDVELAATTNATSGKTPFRASMQTAKERSLLTWMCYVAMVTVAFPMAVLPLFLTQLQREFSMDDEEAGQVMSMGFLGVVVAIVVVSPLADRMGSKPFILLGAASGCAGFLVQTYATSGTEILVCAFLEGFGVAQSEMLMSPIVAVMYPEDRTTALQWLHSSYSIGSFGTMAATAFALHQGVDWRVVTSLIAVAYAASGLAFITQRIPMVVADHTGKDEPLTALLNSAPFWISWALFTFGGAAGAGPSTWIPAYFENVRGFERSQSDLVILLFSLCTAGGRVLAGRYASKLGHATLLGYAGAASAALLALTVWSAPTQVAVAAVVLSGLCMSAMWPTSLAIAGDCHPNGGAKMYGLLFIGGNLGGGIMSWLVGYVAERSDLTFGFLTCAVPPLLLGAVYFAFRGFLRPVSDGKCATEPTSLQPTEDANPVPAPLGIAKGTTSASDSGATSI